MLEEYKKHWEDCKQDKVFWEVMVHVEVYCQGVEPLEESVHVEVDDQVKEILEVYMEHYGVLVDFQVNEILEVYKEYWGGCTKEKGFLEIMVHVEVDILGKDLLVEYRGYWEDYKVVNGFWRSRNMRWIVNR